jgi:hypothetical protein
MKRKSLFSLLVGVAFGLVFASAAPPADKPDGNEKLERRWEEEKRLEEFRRDERLGGALIMPKGKTNAPAAPREKKPPRQSK